MEPTDDDLGVARIGLDGDWELASIGDATHAYVQLYAAAGLLTGITPLPWAPDASSESGRYSYPWRGGYSSVHFFRSLYSYLPRRYRPEVLEISYASPGAIEIVGACLAIAFVVRTLTSSAHRLIGVYREVEKEIVKKKLNRLSVREREAHVQFIEKAYSQLGDAMDLTPEASQRLVDVTQQDRWARLKIAMALARRVMRVLKLTSSHSLSVEDATPLSQLPTAELTPEKRRKIGELAGMPVPDQVTEEAEPEQVRRGDGGA